MDAVQQAFIRRAQDALSLATNETAEKAATFVELARCMAVAAPGTVNEVLRKHWNPEIAGILQKDAGAFALAGWTPEARALAEAFVESIAEGSLLDQIARYATALPVGQRSVLVATGSTANVVSEGDPKLIRKPGLSPGDVDPIKAAAVIVLSVELDRYGGKFRRIIESELAKSITRASNSAVLAELVSSSTPDAGSGDDPLETLRIGLQAAGPSNGYVVAVPTGDCAWLATHEANRGAGVRGGEFVPGVHLVAVDDATNMTIVPASRLALRDWGLEVRGAEHATVNMVESEGSPSTLVNLWQTNSVGLIAERNFLLGGDYSGVVTAGGAS